MGIEYAGTRPTRCSLVNVESAEVITCLFNPTQLSEKVQINWNRVTVPGLSHQLLQFQSTGNRHLSGVEFYLDRFLSSEQIATPDSFEFRAFLRALTVPPKGTEGVTSAPAVDECGVEAPLPRAAACVMVASADARWAGPGAAMDRPARAAGVDGLTTHAHRT